MAYVITSLCLRDGGCSTVCPVECIVPGDPVDQYPWYYIDPDTCIDCGACVPECPFEAIFPLDEVPSAYIAKGGEKVTMPKGTAGFNEVYDGADHFGNPVHIESARTLQAGERLDLRDATQMNADYYTKGPGYGSK